MKKRRFESAALAVIATSFAFVPGLRAQQTGPGPERTRPFDGVGIIRTFRPDGTIAISGTGIKGTWQLVPDGLKVTTTSGGVERRFQFPLPINPNGTKGAESTGKTYYLRKAALANAPQ